MVNNIQNSSSLFLMKTTMTIFTTLLMICCLGREYPFEPRNLYLIEFLVIGLPSFFLALKPNKRVSYYGQVYFKYVDKNHSVRAGFESVCGDYVSV